MRTFGLLLAAVLAVSSCKKPEPPVITPKESTIVAVDPTGVRVLVRVEAQNPNGIGLTVQSVTGRVVLDGRYDLGEVTVSEPVSLPPRSTTTVEVPLQARWPDLATLGILAAANRAVPYTVDATARIGGERIAVNVPFRLQGVVTADYLVQAAMRSLPPLPLPR
jgi:LEA14-like dessication related protein